MPKGYVETEPVNKEIFMQVLCLKKSSIRKLDETNEVECSDKTIRRSLNKGQMRRQYIEQIAKFLDVDSRLLTGELVSQAFVTTDPVLREVYMRPLKHIEEFPYFRGEQERLHREAMSETLKRILSLFEISYKQFAEKSFEEQYVFQHDLFSAILPVIHKHFERDGYGDSKMTECQRIFFELECYYDYNEEENYADNILRKRFLACVPEGYTKRQIEKMSTEELIQIDMKIQAHDKENE